MPIPVYEATTLIPSGEEQDDGELLHKRNINSIRSQRSSIHRSSLVFFSLGFMFFLWGCMILSYDVLLYSAKVDPIEPAEIFEEEVPLLLGSSSVDSQVGSCPVTFDPECYSTVLRYWSPSTKISGNHCSSIGTCGYYCETTKNCCPVECE